MDPFERLLGADLDDVHIRRLLAPTQLANWRAAHRSLQRIANSPEAKASTARVLPHLIASLSTAANADRVLVSFERFTQRTDDKLATLTYLAEQPRAIEILVTLFAGSQFLTEILLSHPQHLQMIVAHKRLATPKGLDQFCAEAQNCTLQDPVSGSGNHDPLDALRRYQRLEQLRIGTCDLLGLFDLSTTTEQISHLADSLVRACLDVASAKTGIPVDGFVVIAMGKLGGNELNYSSDIDLLFLCRSEAMRFRRLGQVTIDALTRTTTTGFLYRVDMRLRPWGQSGPLVSTLSGHLDYLNKNARLWEKQALLKARPIAGDLDAGQEFLEQVEPLLLSSDAASIRADVHAMKQRTEQHLRQRGRSWGEVKLGEGSIRDVEFVVQYLQLSNGKQMPQIRCRNTLESLDLLAKHGLLQPKELRILQDGYVFLRTLEHHLQMMHYRQTHSLPEGKQDLAHLAHRLGFEGQRAGERLIARYEQHRTALRAIYLAYLENRDMEHATPQNDPTDQKIARHLERMDVSYRQAFDQQEIELHSTLAAALDRDTLVEVRAVPLDGGRWRVTIVAFDYPGELSLICGLLFVHGLSIQDGHVFTYESATVETDDSPSSSATVHDTRLKIVDVFTVYPVQTDVNEQTWTRYRTELEALLQMMHQGKRREARGELTKRVASSLRGQSDLDTTLYPIEIEIDNTTSDRYTVLRIDTQDTIGFLYEFANALATNRVYIARVTIDSIGNRVHDTLYVTDANGSKIVSPQRQRELRAATVMVKHFTHLLPHSPNPESALLHFREFVGQLFKRTDWADELASLENPEVLDALARLLGVSEFLWNDFLRMQHANLFPVVSDIDALDTSKSREQLQEELESVLASVHAGPQPPSETAPWRIALNAFKDREMFRIDMRHILGHTQEFGEFSRELTDLAEVIVNSTYHLCHQDLRTVYGTPCLDDGQISEMSVCALGKCGGRELGFASDIELLFVYAGNGKTSGPHEISTAEFYEKVVQDFARSIVAKREGIFEVDLQLRPYGKSSSMAVSLQAFERYFAPDGPAWAYERQALVKLRPIAGDTKLGQKIVALRDRFVYSGEGFDTRAMRAMRERQVRHLVEGGTFNAKFSPGGLVDIEYLVQGLQIAHGHKHPALRKTNIREAMDALVQRSILTENDYTNLHKAHTFLRWLIDGLRMVRGNARDLTVPPSESEAFSYLARRLRYGHDVGRLESDLTHYAASVQELNARLLT